MARTLNRFAIFLAELQRRRVGRVAIAYAAIAFVLLQLGEIVLPAFGAPDWALRVLVVSTFLGFPPAMVLAWIFDVTSEGIRRTREPALEDGFTVEAAEDQSSTGGSDGASPAADVAPLAAGSATVFPSPDRLLPRMALLGITALTAVSLGWWVFQSPSGREASASHTGSSPDLAFAGVAGGPEIPEIRSLAVLPLDDFSQEEGGNPFTSAMHEELVNQLGHLGGVRVVSRTSVAQYDRTGKTMPVIARELGVDAVVEGSVFRAGDRVRISVQLIHGTEDRHLWAGSYEGTMEDAIALQGDVAEAIAREIRAEFFPDMDLSPDKVRLAANPEAQEAFLKGRFEQARATPEALLAAEGHYRDAVRLDSNFAPAYAGLAATRFLMALEGSGARNANGGVAAKEVTLPGESAPSPEGVTEPLRRALVLDRESPEARALLLIMRDQMAPGDRSALPDEVRSRMETDWSLGSELVLTGTEFGRELQRVVLEKTPGPGREGAGPRRLAGVQRLQGGGDFGRAAAVLQQMILEPGAPLHAWDALEQIKTLQGDFDGALEVRRKRVAMTDPSPEAFASLQRLELLLETERERGYWIWRLGEMEARRVAGEAVSRVESARIRLALGRREEALADLNEAVRLQDRNLLSLWSDPAWDPLRADPDFLEIQSRIRQDGSGLEPDQFVGLLSREAQGLRWWSAAEGVTRSQVSPLLP